MSLFNSTTIKDGANLDAFSRLRVSQAVSLFDSQMTYGLNPLVFEQITAETGATITHDADNRCASLVFSSTPTGGKAIMQSYEHVPYQPSKGQLIFVTFNFKAAVTNCLKFAGYSDGTNGIEFQLDGSTKKIALLSGTTQGSQIISQSSWNLDKLDGTGASGLTLDIAKCQILVIDFQALYVGRVRVGFDIDGVIYYAHEFLNANKTDYPYFQTANLPVRCGMTCTGTVSASMFFICSAVNSEGGRDENFGYEFSTDGAVTAGSGTRTHLLSLRPKTLFNSIVNRSSVGFIEVDFLVTGANPIFWELCIGQALTTPTYSDVNATYSSTEKVSAGTLSGNPALVIDSGYVAATNTVKGASSTHLTHRYPITLNAAGANRDLGTLTFLVTGIGGTSACQCSVKFKENR